MRAYAFFCVVVLACAFGFVLGRDIIQNQPKVTPEPTDDVYIDTVSFVDNESELKQNHWMKSMFNVETHILTITPAKGYKLEWTECYGELKIKAIPEENK